MYDPITEAYNNLEPSIKNMAKHYPEGRNVLMYCLTRTAKRSDRQVIEWLENNNIQVYKLHEYRFR
jgi:hypothetical protein